MQIQLLTNLSCNLRCTYCYENLSGKKNDTEKMLKFIESRMKEKKPLDNELILDIIGGEPFMVVEMLDSIFQFTYNKHKEYGFSRLGFSLSTNGTLLYLNKQKELMKKWANYMWLGISIDGTKEKHDKHRITINGKGSYDNAIKGLNTALEILGKDHINIKATFTKDSILEYGKSFIELLELNVKEITLNYNFEEKFDEYDAIPMTIELLKGIDVYINMKNKCDITHITHTNSSLKGRFILTENPLINKKHKFKPLQSNRCGSCNQMLTLGFDDKLYGCNRFVSMEHDNMEIGVMNSNGDLIRTNFELKDSVLNAYKKIPLECQSCKFNTHCSDCVAQAWDEKISPDILYAQRRQCGFTKAKAVAKLYGQRLIELKRQYHRNNQKVNK